jgi:outer membrane protein TolC
MVNPPDDRARFARLPAAIIVFVLALLVPLAVRAQDELEQVPPPDDVVRLTLDQCIATALENQPAIARREAAVGAAEEQRKIARSYFYPHVGFEARYVHLDQPESVDIPGVFDGVVGDVFTDAAAFFGIARLAGSAAANAALNNPNNPPFSVAKQQAAEALPDLLRVDLLGRNVVTTDLLITQPLWTGGKIKYRHQQATLGVEAAGAEMAKSQQETVFHVKRAYVSVQLTEELVAVADDFIGRMRAMESLVQALIDESDEHVSVVDLHRVRAVRAMAEGQRIAAEQGRQLAYQALRQAMGVEELVDFRVADPWLTAWRREVDPWVMLDEAMIRRPELGRARIGVQIAQLERKLATADYMPDLVAFGRFDTINDDGGYANPNDRERFASGVTFSVPLFEGGRRSAQCRKARFEIAEAEMRRQWVRQLVILDVQKAYLEYVELSQRLPVARRAMNEWADVIQGYRNQFFGDQVRDDDMPEYFKDLVETRVLHAVAQAHYYRTLCKHNIALARIRLVSASDVYQDAIQPAAPADPPEPDGGDAGR